MTDLRYKISFDGVYATVPFHLLLAYIQDALDHAPKVTIEVVEPEDGV